MIMPERALTFREPISSSRSGGALANGLSSRAPLSGRSGEGRGVTDAPRGAMGAPPVIDQDIITRGLITGGAAATPETYARLFPSQPNATSPASPGVLTGPSDPFDTLSDVFRSVFGPDLSGRTDNQQALTPVTTGGGASPLIWILLLAGIGGAIYLYYRNKGA